MKKRKIIQVLGAIVIITLLAAACAKKEAYDTAATGSMGSTATSGSTGSISYDVNAPIGSSNYGVNKDSITLMQESDSGSDQNAVAPADAGLSSTFSILPGGIVQPQDKIIRTFNMDVETQEFDSLITKISSEINSLGGYVESSQINGKRYYNNDQARFGNIIARIPSDKVDEFVNVVNDNANVVNKQEATENVSLQYIEAESRIETLKIEQERLFAILEQEVDLQNIITLESRLSDIRFELQNYESQIRYYDNLVAYSTVTMSIQEVEKLTPVTQEKQTVGTRIKNGFSDTMYNISRGFKNFFVWFIVNLPYLLIWAVIIVAIVFIIRRYLRKSNAKKVTSPPLMYFGTPNNGQPNQNQVDQNQQMQNQQAQNPSNRNKEDQN